MKKHNNEKLLTYVSTSNKNNPELFREITENFEEFKHNDKIKEILDTTKIIKSHRQPKNLLKKYSLLPISGNNTLMGSINVKNKNAEFAI